MYVMIDLETLGLVPASQIIQLGAVAVQDLNDEEKDWDTFLVSMPQTFQRGYTTNPDTIAWWEKQSEAAKEGLKINLVPTINIGLSAFSGWLTRLKWSTSESNTIWARSPQFDCSILATAFRIEEREVPWTFRQERCVRTIMYECGHFGEDLTENEDLVAHRADHDALRQMSAVVEIKRRMEKD